MRNWTAGALVLRVGAGLVDRGWPGIGALLSGANSESSFSLACQKRSLQPSWQLSLCGGIQDDAKEARVSSARANRQISEKFPALGSGRETREIFWAAYRERYCTTQTS